MAGAESQDYGAGMTECPECAHLMSAHGSGGCWTETEGTACECPREGETSFGTP